MEDGTILVLEDNELDYLVLARQYDVIWAKSIAEAKDVEFDIILSDLGLARDSREDLITWLTTLTDKVVVIYSDNRDKKVNYRLGQLGFYPMPKGTKDFDTVISFAHGRSNTLKRIAE